MYHRKVFSQDLKAGTFFETVKKKITGGEEGLSKSGLNGSMIPS